MKIGSVTVENFRSITNARRIPISQFTTLVGPNNEGKSNLLTALVVAMTAIGGERGRTYRTSRTRVMRIRRARRRGHIGGYDWSADFPLKMQSKFPDEGSVITLEFELSAEDVTDFQKKIRTKIGNALSISVTLTNESVDLAIPSTALLRKTLNNKIEDIAKFIAARIEVQYIPAVRTAESALSIVEELVERELQQVEEHPRYKQALDDIAALQQPILDRLSNSITDTMKAFLPNIARAVISIEEQDRSFALRGISQILLDDGVETSLQYKGDGVQSLAALALMRYASQSESDSKEVIVALEEPESHLHPKAIRELRNVLSELSTKHQIVITTHNPIFTNRINVQNNVIVSKSKAYPAQSVKEVREVLGVRLDDNLSSAEVILIVEGEEDRIFLNSFLPQKSKVLEIAMQSGRLAIDVLGGAGNLTHRIRLHTENLCRVHVLLDSDSAGKAAFEKAKGEKLLDTDSLNFTAVSGKTEAELEDLYEEAVYEEILLHETGFRLIKTSSDKKKKWADRVRNLLAKAGKPKDDATMLAIKIKVARSAAEQGLSALNPGKSGPIESLTNSLEAKLA